MLTVTILLVVALLIAATLFAITRRRPSGGEAAARAGAAAARSIWVTQPVADGVETGVAVRKGGERRVPSVLGLDQPDRSPRGLARPGSRLLGFVAALLVGVGLLTAGWHYTQRTGDAPVDDFVWVEVARAPAPPVEATPIEAAPAEVTPADEDGGREAEAYQMTAEDPASGLRLIAWSGSGQAGEAGRPLRRALAVVVRDGADRPVPGVEVHFRVARGGGRVSATSVPTNDLGLAATTWWLGNVRDSLRVTAYLAEPRLRVDFAAALADRPGAGPRLAAVRERLAPPATEDRRALNGGVAEHGAGESEVEESAPTAPVQPRIASRSRPGFSAGGVQTCRLAAGGRVVCWGGDERGGDLPSGAPDGAPALWALSAGVFHSCGLTNHETVYCWTAREGARPGLASPGTELVLPDEAPPVEVVAGSEHSCALALGGAVYCWGANAHGQVGDGTTSDAASPVRVQGLPAATQLAAGWLHTCALTSASEVYCWGANGRGQLGDGGDRDRTRPVAVAHPDPFAAITGGSTHSCGLTHDGTAWCWGSNDHGQLGTGTGRPARQPQRVAGDNAFRTLAAGGVHSCGLTTEGRAWCWGRNTFGQLGNGTVMDSPVPVPVADGPAFVAIAAGGAHTCAETEAGGVYCWGNNVQGQVGDGTRENRETPVPVRAGGRP